MTARPGPAPVVAAGLPAHRVLGALGVLGAFGSLVIGLGGPPAKTDLRANLLMTAYLAGWACSAVAMRRLRVTGRGRGSAIVFAIQMVALALAACQQPQDQLGRRPLGDAVYMVTDLSWPFSHVFMLVVFVAVWRARVWTGWRRWVPLACGLALPVTFAAAAARFPSPGLVFALGTALSFAALGIAVATSPGTWPAAALSMEPSRPRVDSDVRPKTLARPAP